MRSDRIESKSKMPFQNRNRMIARHLPYLYTAPGRDEKTSAMLFFFGK